MTTFIDVPGMTAWIRDTGVQRVLAGLVDRLEEDVARWTAFERMPRVASHSGSGVIELMPTSDGSTYAFKYVNGHPINPSRGLQTVTAFGVLADVETGYPVLWAEMTLLTALRTAATSALAARHFAVPGASTMAMIGTGSQAEFQALAFRETLGIERLRVWDVDAAALDKFRANVEPLGFDVVVAADAAEAALGVDVITTCTADKAYATVLEDEMVAAGTHVNAIGGDCPGKTELDPRILRRAAVFVEHEPQTRIEGEIQQMEPDFPVTELWRVVTGESPGRTFPGQVTVFDSVGFAIEDHSALTFVRDAVRGTGYAREVDLVADPADPKDLFGMLGPVLTPTSG